MRVRNHTALQAPAPDIMSRPHGPLTREDVMSSGDVGALLGVAKSTVESWARSGLIPNHKRGKRRFFLRWEIEAWLTSGT